MRKSLQKVFLLLVSLALTASAGAANVVISNSDSLTIGILDGSTVQFDAQGNLILQCRTVSGVDTRCCTVVGGDQCVPLGATPGDTTPPTTPGGLAATATSSTAISLTWTASTDAGSGVSLYRIERCSGASCANFSQIATSATNSFNNTSLTASTLYRYRVRAQDGAGNLSGYSNTAEATTQSGGGTGACTATGPLIQPSNMTRIDKTWEQAFGTPWNCSTNCTAPPQGYPQSWSFGMPIGSNKNSYTAIAIDPGPNVTVGMFWDPAQANSSVGYNPPRPAESMYVTISPCAGDLRLPNNSTGDNFERTSCRVFLNTGSLFYSTVPGSVASVCRLTAGTRYYINVSPVDPSTAEFDGILDGHTCGSGSASGCEVQMRHDRQ